MTPDILQTFLLQDFPGLLTKTFILVVIFFYCIFAAVLLRQIQIMNKVVTLATFSPILTLIALVHLIASIGLFIFALFSL